MKIIALPTDEKEAKGIFGIMYFAAFQGKGPEDLETSRNLEALQNALKAVSYDDEPIKDREGNEVVSRILSDGVTEIRMESAPWRLLLKRFFGAGVPWFAGASPRINAAHDLVDKATEELPVVKKVEEPVVDVKDAPKPKKLKAES